jgi:hypothetical protein
MIVIVTVMGLDMIREEKLVGERVVDPYPSGPGALSILIFIEG